MNSNKQPASVESLPEDIIPLIVNFIKGWAQIKFVGVDWKKKMEIARASRDSALRAMVVSSKESYDKWLPFLLEEVTLRRSTLASFFYMLNVLPGSGQLVKTLRLEPDTDDEDVTSLEQLWDSFSNSSRIPEARLKSLLLEEYLIHCTNLQTLILLGDILTVPLVNGGTAFRYLTSLKHLFVSKATSEFDEMMNARNVIWILVFCPHLVQAVLSFNVDLPSFNYLQEYASIYEDLSNVKQLSLAPRFIWNAGTEDEPRWKGFKKGKQEAKGLGWNSLTTQTVYYLLKVTKNLDALEVIGEAGSMLGDEMTKTKIYPDCLKGASSSYYSLKHLRSNMFSFQGISTVTVSIFGNLKIFSLDLPQLLRLEREGETSHSVQTLHLYSYMIGNESISPTETHLMEDRLLSNILTLGLFPNLQRVCVPSKLVNPDGNFSTSAPHLKVWKRRRQELKENEAIKSGKIQLESIELGETIGDASKGETCPSAFDWISPFPA